MPTQYEPPIRFHDWERPTRDGPMRPPEHIEDWVPCQEEIPPGPSPQAVRVIRKGQETVTFRLLTTQPYRVGRHPNCQLYFRDDRVSRQHGLLYFASEISGWVYRDAKSTTGTFIRRSDAPAARKPVGHGRPIGIVAGQTLELADGENRLEFLETVPPELIAASGRWPGDRMRVGPSRSPSRMPLARADLWCCLDLPAPARPTLRSRFTT